MKFYSKTILLASICSLFFGIVGVHAEDKDWGCTGTPPDGQRYAVFALKDENGKLLVSDTCVLVGKKDDHTTFDVLSKAGLFQGISGEVRGSIEYTSCYGDNWKETYTEKVGTTKDKLKIDDQVQNINYLFLDYIFQTHSCEGEMRNMKVNIRYRIEASSLPSKYGSDVYLYFLGFQIPKTGGEYTLELGEGICTVRYTDASGENTAEEDITLGQENCTTLITEPGLQSELVDKNILPEGMVIVDTVWNSSPQDKNADTDSGQSPLIPAELKKDIQSLNKIRIDKKTMVTAENLPRYIGQIVSVLMGIVGSIALLFIVYGGALWMTAAGNAERSKKGLETLIWAGIGIVVIFASYSIVDLLFNVF